MKIRYILSHILVAVLATALTLFFVAPQQPSPEIQKLQALESLIDDKFVEE